jgi:hypothetical protein
MQETFNYPEKTTFDQLGHLPETRCKSVPGAREYDENLHLL